MFNARDELVENVRSFYTLHLMGTHRTVQAVAFSAGLNSIHVDQVNSEDNS